MIIQHQLDIFRFQKELQSDLELDLKCVIVSNIGLMIPKTLFI